MVLLLSRVKGVDNNNTTTIEGDAPGLLANRSLYTTTPDRSLRLSPHPIYIPLSDIAETLAAIQKRNEELEQLDTLQKH
jgi:hypothetical protein